MDRLYIGMAPMVMQNTSIIIIGLKLTALSWTIAIVAQKNVQYSVILRHGFVAY